MRNKSCALVVFCLISSAGWLQAQTLCPDCNRAPGRLQPNAEHGSSGSRRKVNICLGSGWGSNAGTVDSAIYNAANAWNVATGTGACPNDQIPFVLQSRSSNCDIIVDRETSSKCANAQVPAGDINTSNPARINVHADALATGNLDFVLRHEIGHVLGLPNANPYSSCAHSTVMGGIIVTSSSPSVCEGVPQNATITSGDVDSVRRKEFSESSCYYNTTITSVDSCDFDECYDWVDSYSEAFPNGTNSECYDWYEITDYYWCTGNGCTYLGSTYRYLFTDCFVW